MHFTPYTILRICPALISVTYTHAPVHFLFHVSYVLSGPTLLRMEHGLTAVILVTILWTMGRLS